MRIEFHFERNTAFLSGFSSVNDAKKNSAGISGAQVVEPALRMKTQT
jgi:hypothetical protein